MHLGTEILHSSVRRYTSPDEHPFHGPSLPDPILPPLTYPSDLLSPDGDASAVNYNAKILDAYVSRLLPLITRQGDDSQYGSAVLLDINLLQSLSKVRRGKTRRRKPNATL